MKKIIVVLLILVMCIPLVACGGNEDEIQNALQGSWVAEWTAYGQSISRTYTFKGNNYTTSGITVFGSKDVKTGTFEVKDSTIHLISDDGSSESDLDFSYNKKTGELILWWNDDIQFQKKRANVNYN